jgi:hypothetical protein
MLNRPTAALRDTLDTRHSISLQVREQLAAPTPSPVDWSTFDATAALGTSGTADVRLAALGRLLCTAPARTAELRELWNECVATAAFALRLAPHLGGDARSSAIAGLLHRLGDLLTLRAIAAIEHGSQHRLDSATRSSLCLEHGGAQLERTLRAWNVPARAAATAVEWRRLHEFPGAAADAAAVYLARLFAIEWLTPQFCAPGVIESAAEEMGLDAASLSGLRGDATIAPLLCAVPGEESREIC